MAKQWVFLGSLWGAAIATFILLALSVEGFVRERQTYEEARVSIEAVDILKTRGEQLEKLAWGLKYSCQMPQACALRVREKIKELCDRLDLDLMDVAEKKPASPGPETEHLTLEAVVGGDLLKLAALLAMMEEKVPALVVERILTQSQERASYGKYMHTILFTVHMGK